MMRPGPNQDAQTLWDTPSWFRENYRKIAVKDLESSMQSLESLAEKARTDLQRLGDIRGKKVLEVGPGRGHLAIAMQQQGAKVDLLDVVGDYLELLKDRVDGRLIVGDVETFVVSPEDKYDVVVLCDVLEHLLRPQDALLALRQALVPGGAIYVRVPAHESLLQYSRRLGCPWSLVHLRTYTRYTLRLELIASGFSLVKGPSGRGTPGFFPNARLWPQVTWARWRSQIESGWLGIEVKKDFPTEKKSAFLLRLLDRALRVRTFAWVIGKPQELWAIAKAPQRGTFRANVF